MVWLYYWGPHPGDLQGHAQRCFRAAGALHRELCRASVVHHPTNPRGVRDTARADAQASRFRCLIVVPALQVVGVAQGTKLPGFHRGKFDGHMELQRQSFLRPGRQQESKYHGKIRTKFDLVALWMHALHVVWQSFKESSEGLQSRPGCSSRKTTLGTPIIRWQWLTCWREKCEKTCKQLDFTERPQPP